MEVWKNGSMEVKYTGTLVNKGLQPTVNEMCFIKNTFIIPYFHSSILATDLSKFFICLNH
jgi:hypothetical protein